MTEGLEVSVVGLSALADGNPAWRFDAEFFRKVALAAIDKIIALPFDVVGSISRKIQHPQEVVREYVEDGLKTLMAGNVRPNRADVSLLPMMDFDLREHVARNLIANGDVLLVRTGANYGTVAPWKHTDDVYACADLLIVRAPATPGGYLSSFLSGSFGKPLVDRCSYGSAQPHISPLYIGLIPVPRFATLEASVEELVDRSIALQRQSSETLAEAEVGLLDALGLRGWSPPEPLTYTSSATAVAASARLDPQYFMPAKTEMLAALCRLPGGVISDSFDSVRDMVNPQSGPADAIVRNYDLTNALQPVLDASTPTSRFDEIDSQKKRLRDGDLAVSRLRSYLREIAVVRVTDDIPAIGSSEFFVLRQRSGAAAISAEALMIYLRSPPVQTVLKWCQDGSQHPRFAERDLMSIPLPDLLAELNTALTAKVRDALNNRARSLDLLAAAKRAVEIAIEDSEAAALAFIAEHEAA